MFFVAAPLLFFDRCCAFLVQMARRLIAGGLCYLAIVIVELVDAVDWANVSTVYEKVLLYLHPHATTHRLNYFFRDLFLNAAALITCISFATALLNKKNSASTSGTARGSASSTWSKVDANTMRQDTVVDEDEDTEDTDEEAAKK